MQPEFISECIEAPVYGGRYMPDVLNDGTIIYYAKRPAKEQVTALLKACGLDINPGGVAVKQYSPRRRP
ncbi:MAG: hypothetical protein LBQ83_02925 [Candidatus Margulisbacteria bacterium]|jgi:hypothetical protein|nr:hypothetical protein [Candidatus Margulisiibacteriota bacterium]